MKSTWFSYLLMEMFFSVLVLKNVIYLRPNIIKTTKALYNSIWEHRSFSDLKLKTDTGGRHNLKTMKLESTQFNECITDETIIAKDLFISSGFEIRIVGGAVRDLLLGQKPGDLDFATTATPEQMKAIFQKNNLRLINRNGEKHGTITVRIKEKNFEITTLRVDKKTDGRHAEVEFTTDWFLDASRRDLTINAMYLDFDGVVYDYFNGHEDLKKSRIRFVGDASKRIQEDHLRILRYFRFYGKIAQVPDNHDLDILDAIKNNAHGLRQIAGERILMELTKILSGRFAGEMLRLMFHLNVGEYIGLPKKCNEEELKKVSDTLKMKDIEVKPMTLLSSVFYDINEVEDFVLRVKPSSAERNLLLYIVNHRDVISKHDPFEYCKGMLVRLKKSENKKFLILELLKYKGYFDVLKKLDEWVPPIFPVKSAMLKDKGLRGKNYGVVFSELLEIWIESDFTMTAEQLLEKIPDDVSRRDDMKPLEKKKKIA